MWMRPSSALTVALSLLVALPILGAPALSAQDTGRDGAGLTVYSEVNYGGQQETLRGDTPTLKAIGANNLVSSVRIQGHDDAWELCEEANYAGRCVVLPRSEPNLASKGWKGRVSSARRIYGSATATTGTSLSGIELFSEPHFRGRSNRVDRAERSVEGSAAQVGSMRVRAGTWEVCEQASFRGRCALVAGEIPDVRAVGLDDHVGSLRLHVNLR